jgi:23S rRNA U2552 (ribose-2'-O)-methylase RlmE/FtsJ
MKIPCVGVLDIPNISIQTDINMNNMVLFEDLHLRLKECKNKIDDIETKKWDKVKKNNNPYELLHISSNRYHQSISKYRPISRSYFKLIELTNMYNLLLDDNMVIGCVSEGPGGFIESILNTRNNINDKIYGITLNTYNKHIPGWKRLNDILSKRMINKKNNVKLLYGNIYLLDDIKNYCKLFINNKADLITSDGGFDYSINFNNQEQLSYRIIFSEIVIALSIQKMGGHFICKCFDLLTVLSLKLIYLLYCFYDEIYIYKPNTSRPANSEKYIIAKGFKGIDPEYLNNLYNMIDIWSDHESDKNIIIDIFDNILSDYFINIMYGYNSININNQIDYINNTLCMIDNKPNKDDFNKIIENQTLNALDWCINYNIEVNDTSKYIKHFNKSI